MMKRINKITLIKVIDQSLEENQIMCHCEERSDEAILKRLLRSLRSLAMTPLFTGRLLIRMMAVLILFLSLMNSANAGEESKEGVEKPKKVRVEKTLSGQVSGISSNFIAILYGQDKKTSYEMALAMDKDTKVERKKSLKEIKSGDTVSVKYEETTQVVKEKAQKGKEKDVVKVLARLAKVVAFVRAPAEGLQSSEEPVSIVNEEPQKEEALDQEESQEGELQ